MLIHLWLPMALLAPMSFMLFIQLVILKHHMQQEQWEDMVSTQLESM
jgi:hypothetical protein